MLPVKQNHSSASTNWKEIALVGLFILGAIGIVASYKPSAPNTSPTSPTSITEISPTTIPTPAEEELSVKEMEVSPETKTEENRAIETKTEPTTTEVKTMPSYKNVESPLSQLTTRNKTVTETSPPKPKVIVTPAVVSAKTTPTPITVPKETARAILPSTTATLTPKGITPTAPASAPTSTGSFYLVAASRPTFEQAQISFDEFARLGYKPILLSPIKSKGISNYRVAIFRNTDRKKVEDMSSQIDGKSKGFWIDQR